MTGPELEEARAELGRRWNLGEPLTAADLGRLVNFEGRDPGRLIRGYETAEGHSVHPAVAAYVRLVLDFGLHPYSAPGSPGAHLMADEKPPPVTTRRRGPR